MLVESRRQVYLDIGDRHSVVVGATGSKKTRYVGLPLVFLLGKAKESMVIADPKGEIFDKSSKYLEKQGYEIDLLDFRSPKRSTGWNPLLEPYREYAKGNESLSFEQIHDIAEQFIEMGKGHSDPFWDNSAGSLFFGLAVLLFEFVKCHGLDESYASLNNIIYLRKRMYRNGESSNNGRNLCGVGSSFWKIAEKLPRISLVLKAADSQASETNAGILSVFDSKMFFLDISPDIVDMLNEKSDSAAKMTGKPGVTFLVYPDEKRTYNKLITLYIKQSYEQIIRAAQKNSGVSPTRINYVLDEFASLPAIGDFPSMITAARSRNIRFHLLIQSRHQLRLRYGEEAETIMSNCENWIYLFGRDVSFLNDLSTLCGTYEVDNGSRPVIPVSTLQHLSKDSGDALILHGRCKPYLSTLLDFAEYGFEQDGSLYMPMKDSGARTSIYSLNDSIVSSLM